MKPVSELIIGGSGTGKSVGKNRDLLAAAIAKSAGIFVMDGHGLLGQDLALQLINKGLQRRLVYDRLSKFNKVLAGMSLRPSSAINMLEYEAENQQRVAAFMALLWRASQRTEDIFAMPMMSMYVEYGIRLIMFQKTPVPFSALVFAYRLNHPICEHLIDNCTDEEVVEEWRELQRLQRKQSDNILESKLGPAKRLVRSVFGQPAFRERCDGHADIGQLCLDKQIVIVDGLNAPKEAVTAVVGGLSLQIFQFLQENFARTGKPCPVILVWEEAAAFNLIGDYELDMLREGRKYGLAAIVMSQDENWADPRMSRTIKSCAQIHKYYNPRDPEIALSEATELALAQLNPDLVKHEQWSERMVFDGYETKKRKGVSTSEDRETKSESEYEQAKYKRVEDVKRDYYSFDDQIKIKAQQLLTMIPGQYMEIRPGYVSARPEYSPMLENPWPEHIYGDLARRKLEQAIAQSQSRPEFKTPVSLAESWQLPETTTPSPTDGMIVSINSSANDSKPPQGKSSRQSPNSKKKRG